ncbi:helix-turn-helix domain-containing protein [Falsiroseomonas sp. HW251]|uniref:helix-turn-helix domain-containing protein n=1 Tax=Falsiroseomonas sp. HW251 TaxID=3390998 RepID=UPI003D31F0A2
MKAETRQAWAAEITDLDELAAAQGDARMEHSRTASGPFRLRMRVADFGTLRLQSNEASNGYIAQGVLRADRFGLLLPTGGPAGESRFNGSLLGADDIVLARPGAEILAHARAGAAWAALLLGDGEFGTPIEDAWPSGAGTFLCVGRLRAAPGLRRLTVEVGDMAATNPAALRAPAVAGAIVEAVSARLAAALATAPERPARASGQHLRVVRRAMDYLDAVLAQPVYSEEVGRALGVSPRALNESFGVALGVSLQQYLRIRRLNLARRLLRQAVEGTLVKTIALDLGFWHLGRFSLAYRDLFGETPSETLAGRPG